jgi:hypothetical protein
MRLPLLIVLVALSIQLQGQNSKGFPIENSNWIATDALHRDIAQFKQTGETKNDKWVGLFYYIWHGYHNPKDTVFDITKILLKNPTNPEYGTEGNFHYWGEPEAGYYRSDDPWVIRRNIAMMVAAGVDFIYFDVTNAHIYLPTVEKYCQISLEMREKGINAPYISFMTNSRSGETLNKIYDAIYAQGKYKDLWFYWEGKPLVFGHPDDKAIKPELKQSLNIKYSWAWTDAENQPDHWQWIDKYPQDFGWSKKGEVDQVPVSVASHPVSNIGTSFSNGEQPELNKYKLTEFTGQGFHFAEQWKQVFKLQPKVVMITQFNEWIAQRFISGQKASPKFLGDPPKDGNTYFVDAYNQEFNRDIEPMKGGHTDNFYFQLVNYIRQFKGMDQPVSGSSSKNIKIDGKFKEWVNIVPKYIDYEGDVLHRNHKGFNENTTYTNTTGRNDVIESRASYDNDYVYFYIKTAKPLTKHTDKNWMLLYVNIDTSKTTGWEGYDLLVNLDQKSASNTSIHTFNEGAWNFKSNTNYSYADNELEIAIPIFYFNTNGKSPVFSFHWTDNNQKLLDINEFFLSGDSAPDRRFDYLFKTE